jgi:hypothetical protein
MKRRNLALVGRNLAHVMSVADSPGAIRGHLYGGRVSAWVKIPTRTTALFPITGEVIERGLSRVKKEPESKMASSPFCD